MAKLFQIDTIIVGGIALDFEDSSGEVDGGAGYEYEVVPAASGDDSEKRKRVARTLNAKLNFGPTTNPDDFVKMRGVQIAMRDSATGRKAVAPNCGFAKMGKIGAGTVDVTFNLLSPLQWL
jgi:hypothetical protein